ncbi:hypothetical protein SLEP1_g41389 [Rubroshorea leprosula]|uniref:Reverse transcriptase domain-containing protein n=1 Tax=Rubroshorea leprosula TaxID=152421 RepID=A0AAV5L7C1_9ROSI|nr:hypothetical protein SLEP1_g41389 [Rubroshorea leprosula]
MEKSRNAGFCGGGEDEERQTINGSSTNINRYLQDTDLSIGAQNVLGINQIQTAVEVEAESMEQPEPGQRQPADRSTADSHSGGIIRQITKAERSERKRKSDQKYRNKVKFNYVATINKILMPSKKMRERGRERGRGGDRRSTARRTTQSRGRGRSTGKWQERRTMPVGQRRNQLNRNQLQQGKLGDSYDWGLYKQAVPYFFTNFPDEWTYADMWNTFRRYGRVYAIYSPNRRSRNGSRFGFVRYLEVKDRRELEMRLDQIWVEGRKLWVNTPRYVEAKMEVREQKTTQGFEPKIQTRSYADVVKSHQEKDPEEKGSKHFTVKQSEGQRNIRSQARSEVGGSDNRKEKFYMEGYFACRIRAMGGKLVLLDCDDKNELKDLVESASEWLGQWFAEVKPWSPEMVADERFVWIRCQGAPLNVWGTDFFAKMGSSWGKFICLDDNTSQKRRFDVARFLLSTRIMNTISVSRQIRINGSMYNVKFTEEEFTNSFFSLKQDFMPTFQSESENEESWSLDSDRDVSDLEKIAEWEQEKKRDVAPEEEDDEVAYSKGEIDGKYLTQDLQVKKGLIEVVAESSVRVQNSNEDFISAAEKRAVQKQGNLEIVVGKVGCNEKHRRRLKCKPKSQGSSPSYVVSSNEGMGQGLRGVGPSLGKIIVMNKDKGTRAVIYEDEEGKAVQRETDDEEEQRQRSKQKGARGDKVTSSVEEVRESSLWEREGDEEQKQISKQMGARGTKASTSEVEGSDLVQWDHDGNALQRQILKQKGPIARLQKRKKKVKLCSAVYRREGEAGVERGKKKKEGSADQIRKTKKGRLTSVFLASPNGEIAGESIGDSGIENCNRAWKEQMHSHLAKEIWDLAKQLGATTEKDEAMVQRIEEMERRDRQKKEEMVHWETEEAKKETKLEVVDRKLCRGVWGSDNFDWTFKPSEGLSRGLLCIWDSSVFERKEVIEGRSFIGVFGVWGEEKILIHLVNIYSPCTLAGKRELWEELGNLINRRKGRWCLGGDFNAVTRVEERAGCKDPTIEMNEFNSFIYDAGLIDLPLIGRKSVSDHCPLVLKNEKVDWGPKPFKFFDAWLEQPECMELIKKAWNSSVEEGRKGFRLKEKLKSTKKALKEWSGNHMSELDCKIKEAEKMIAILDEKGEIAQLSEEDSNRRKGCFLDLWKYLRIKESIWQQKSRKMWLREGDANTKFYHKCVKGRWRRNEINSIQVNGKQLREVGELKEGMAKYFQDLFTENDWLRPKLDGINFKQISHTDNESLMAKFSKEEVKNAVWDCESTKSPRPDEFNFKFIKAMWEDIKQEVIGYIQEFHERGKMEKGANASFIVLIPKVENPQRIEDYRPISLIGVMYKILAKLLANRLRKVLDKIIGEQQMAFIKGRQLLDGVIIANEVIEEVKRKKKNSFLFKVDFEKAYDKECLQSSTVSILINGSPTRQFPVSKGLRQGDPLSPFLFLIVAEGLNGLMLSAVDKNLYKGVRIGNIGVMVSHLQFADDTIFFGEASKENIQVIKCVLRTFELASGLKINYGKSQLMGIGVEEEWKKKMAYILHCKEGELPVKYLGIQIGGNHRKLSMWQPLVNSFKKKLASWKGRDLSMGGRIALINSVLSNLPVFQMSAYLLPKAKEEGGLGVKDLEKFNVALMGKWLSRLANMEEGLWKSVIVGKYGAEGGHWMDWVRDGRNIGSLWWRDVRRLKAGEGVNARWLWEDFRLRIGEGRGVKFWWDSWCGEECLANKFPRLYFLSTGKEKECHEMGNEDRTTWKWNLSWRRNLFEWEEEAVRDLKRMIEEVKIKPGCPNRREWSPSTEGQYSTKIAYQRLSMPRKNPEEEKIFKRVWNPTVPSKVAAFNWKTLLDRIPTKLNLIRRGIIKDMADGKCVLCEEKNEDADHLFLKCRVAKGLWKACAHWWRTNFTLHSDCWTTFQHFGAWTTKPHISEGWDCIWNTVTWTIWMARNGKVFQDSKEDQKRLKSTAETLEAENERLKQENVSMKQQLEDKSKEVDLLKKNYDQRYENEQQMKSAMDSLEADNKNLQKELDDLKNKFREFNLKKFEEEQRMKTFLELGEAKNGLLNTAKRSLEEENALVKQRFEAKSKKLDELGNDFDKLKQKYNKLHGRKQGLKSTIKILEEENRSKNALLEGMSKYSGQMVQLRSKLESLELASTSCTKRQSMARRSTTIIRGFGHNWERTEGVGQLSQSEPARFPVAQAVRLQVDVIRN